ncbi:hypothetical protein FRC18_001759 [Serendipita sp. 400]|nr:hypothetical protein FRC18_001759 [Serendipita sp. 400]
MQIQRGIPLVATEAKGRKYLRDGCDVSFVERTLPINVVVVTLPTTAGKRIRKKIGRSTKPLATRPIPRSKTDHQYSQSLWEKSTTSWMG